MAAGEQHGWRKSSYSNHQGACVEVALDDEGVSVRDSKDPAGAVLTVASRQWATFVRRLRN
ncbi:DUF397 domain-containing protein [Actinopolyspora saharensis]|uniref:DUF397 domain-containing protein n=1 Tax=Actinopolyspora saharensis TaxID=995062 RepID=UPI003F673364